MRLKNGMRFVQHHKSVLVIILIIVIGLVAGGCMLYHQHDLSQSRQDIRRHARQLGLTTYMQLHQGNYQLKYRIVRTDDEYGLAASDVTKLQGVYFALKKYKHIPTDLDRLGDDYRWTMDGTGITTVYSDEWDTFSDFETKDGHVFAQYEMLGDDGSRATYRVQFVQ